MTWGGQTIDEIRAENDALRAEVGRLREALDETLVHMAARPDGIAVIGMPWVEKATEALSSTPLSAAAVERWKAMERVVKEVAKTEPVFSIGYDGAESGGRACFGCNVGVPDDGTPFPHGEQCWWKQAQNLAALDRTEEEASRKLRG